MPGFFFKLKTIFGCERENVTGDWRRFDHEELYDVYSSLNIFQVITSGELRREGNVAGIEEGEMHARFW